MNLRIRCNPGTRAVDVDHEPDYIKQMYGIDQIAPKILEKMPTGQATG